MKQLMVLLFLLVFSLLPFSLRGDTTLSELEKNINSYSGRTKLKNLLILSKKYCEMAPSKGLQYGEEALKLAVSLGDKPSEASALFSIALSNDFLYQFTKGLEYYQKALKLYEELDSTEAIGKCLMNIGTDHNSLGNYILGLNYQQKALEVCGKGKCTIEAEINNNMAFSYYMMGSFGKAIEYGIKALKISEKGGNKKKIAFCYNNVGLMYNQWKDYDQAMVYLTKALQIAEEIKEYRVKNAALTNISNVYLNKNMIKEAFEYENEALKTSFLLNDRVQMASHYDNLSRLYEKTGDRKSTLDFKIKHLRLLEEIGDKSGITDVLLSIGELYFKEGKYNDALEKFKRSLEISEEINYLRNTGLSDYYLSETWAALGDYKKAHDYLKKYTAINDSIFTQESNEKYQRLKISYETEKKVQENKELSQLNALQLRYFIIILALALGIIILLLNRYATRKKALKLISGKNILIEAANLELQNKNERITEQNLALESLNEEIKENYQKINEQNRELEYLNNDLKEVNASKDKFFLILSHELLNPIRWLSNVTDLLIKKVDSLDRAELKDTISILNQSAKESNHLLENLLLWAKIHTGRMMFKPEKIDMLELLNDNINLCKNKISEKGLNIEIGEIPDNFVYADRIMLDTVIRNLLNNAIKFTNNGGSIKISLNRSNGSVKVNFSDTGIGIKGEDVDKLFKLDIHYTTVGTSKEKGSGLGLIICKEFLEKNGGQIWVESEYQKGTTFGFSLPASV